MSYIDEIANRANQLTKRFATRDPFEIAENLGINVFFTKELTTLKGMYFVMKRNRYMQQLKVETSNRTLMNWRE